MKLHVALLAGVALAGAARAEPAADPAALAEQARAAQAAGDRAAALAALERAAAAAPGDADILRRLGTAQGQAGRTDAALKTLAEAARIAPEDADIKLALAQVHYYRGDSQTALRLAQEVLGIAPDNEDARDLVFRARRAVREEGPKWRVDSYVSYSDFDDDARKRWLESGVSLGRRIDERLRVAGRVDVADRFGRTDVAIEGEVERRFGGNSSFTLAAGATPNADFLPQWAIRAGARTRLAAGSERGGIGASVLTLDVRYADYRSGGVETLSPGLEQYFGGGRLWLTGRAIFTWDENDNSQTGWLVRADGLANDGLRLFAGYADAPETANNVTLSTRTVFGGVVIDLSDAYTLRLDYARDDREASYVRNAFTVGFGARFLAMLLADIWYVSLAMALGSTLVMQLLILRRVVQTRASRRRDGLRAAASRTLLDYIDGTADADAVRAAAGGRSDIIGDLIFEMREILRGEGAARLVDLALASGGLDAEQKHLRSRNPGVRAEAVRRIAIYGADAVPALTAALDDLAAGVRTAAAVELTAIGKAPPLALLAERLRVGLDTQSEDLRRIFRRAVEAEPRAAIAMLVDGDTGDELRQLVIDGLGHAGDYQALQIVAAMMYHANPEVRAESLRALASLGHPSAAAQAIEALGDDDWRVRSQAANCVRRIGAADAVPALSPLLEDEQWWVRFRAAEALATLGDDGRARLTSIAAQGDRAGQVAQLVLAERGIA